MANFTGFDQTMDASAVLSVMCEALPFLISGAAIFAKKVRKDIRNEWAHCNFSHWTEPNFQSALQSMELLIKKANLTPVEEKKLLDDLDNWKNKGMALCFGQLLDPELLKLVKTEVGELVESVTTWKEESKSEISIILENLKRIELILNQQVADLIKRQDKSERRQEKIERRQEVTTGKVEKLEKEVKNELSKIGVKREESIPYIFSAPLQNRWFYGRQSPIQELKRILGNEEKVNEEKVCVAAVCGLGGIGKTSLVTEYAHQLKDHYRGGVYWFSGEDDAKLEVSLNYVAVRLGTFHGSFDFSLSNTLQRIAQVGKPWLIVVDCLDQVSLSQNVTKLVSGPWQQGISGHLVIITRRKPGVLVNDIQSLDDCCCIRLECFEPVEAKQFLFSRTGALCNDESDDFAAHLVKELGGLPLALEQAGACIRSLGCSLSEYLEEYKAQRLLLLCEEKARPVSVYESPERLAVNTTWLLNFNHIKQNTNGKSAIRFLNACSFLNPDEIEVELINVGEPSVDDKEYVKCVASPLGPRLVLKMLTDFSLFRDLQGRCVSVHRLVKEVINENLQPEEKAESIVDAVRMLHHAFSKCPSPDKLLSGMAEKHVLTENRSLFYLWSKLCVHSHELRKNLEEFLEHFSTGSKVKLIFFPETARIVYESAVSLSVNCKHKEAKRVLNFAYRILDWVPLPACEVLVEKLANNSLFPHTIPLLKSYRRVIQQCCRAPFSQSKPISLNSSNCVANSDKSEQLEKMRLDGNKLFKESRFKEAITVYSSAVNVSKGTNLFNPRLLSNRASSYLRLEQYENALKDADGYIVQCPDCWKGYARKALALHGLNETVCAELAASLAFYRDRQIFRQFEPFKAVFASLEGRIFVCDNTAQVSNALPLVSTRKFDAASTSVDSLRILVLGSKEYDMSADCFDTSKITGNMLDKDNIVYRLTVGNCILLGVGDGFPNLRVTLNFKGNFGLCFQDKCMAANLAFKCDQCNCYGNPRSFIKLENCYFSSGLDLRPGFDCEGQLNAHRCDFRDCRAGGLLCVRDRAHVESCHFSGNGKAGLEVRDGGSLRVSSSHMYDNHLHGLIVGPDARECIIDGCKIRNNEREGIHVEKSTGVTLTQNHIFNNDTFGISVTDALVVIQDNSFFENWSWGIWVQSNSWCYVSRNKVFCNKTGGIRIGYRARGPDFPESIVEFNNIYDNSGLGLIENVNEFELGGSPNSNIHLMSSWNGSPNSLKPARCQGNELSNNEEQRRDTAAETTLMSEWCSSCQRRDPSKKCGKCFTAAYCGKACQESHWKKHKKLCHFLLEKSSVLPTSMQFSGFDSRNVDATKFDVAGPVGPKYSNPPPKDGTKFVVKVLSTGYPDPPHALVVYDRSLTVYETFESRGTDLLVREFGVSCQRKYEEKKLFLLASFIEDVKLLLFTNEFAPFQEW